MDKAARQEGAGRWHAEGQDLLYASATPELAVLEALAHLAEARRLRYWLCRIVLPTRLRALQVDVEELPLGWQRRPRATRAIGGPWIEACETLALLVPSALVSEATNVLLNPAHPQMRQVRCEVRTPFLFDQRFLRLRAPAARQQQRRRSA